MDTLFVSDTHEVNMATHHHACSKPRREPTWHAFLTRSLTVPTPPDAVDDVATLGRLDRLRLSEPGSPPHNMQSHPHTRIDPHNVITAQSNTDVSSQVHCGPPLVAMMELVSRRVFRRDSHPPMYVSGVQSAHPSLIRCASVVSKVKNMHAASRDNILT